MLKKSILSKLIAKSSVSIRYPMWHMESFESWNWVEVDPSQSFAGLWKKNVADGKEAYQGAQVQACLLS